MMDVMSRDTAADEGFRSIGRPKQRTGVRQGSYATFYEQQATIPTPDDYPTHLRADWAYNDDGILRLRASEGGQYRPSPVGRRVSISTRGLQTALGRVLRGRYPIERAEGGDIYIRIGTAEQASRPETAGAA